MTLLTGRNRVALAALVGAALAIYVGGKDDLLAASGKVPLISADTTSAARMKLAALAVGGALLGAKLGGGK